MLSVIWPFFMASALILPVMWKVCCLQGFLYFFMISLQVNELTGPSSIDNTDEMRFNHHLSPLVCFSQALVVGLFTLFLMVFCCTSHAGVVIDVDSHSQMCGCGMKCKRDRCCCERETNNEIKSKPIENAEAEKNHKLNKLCQWSSPCGQSPALPQSPQNRPFSSKPDMISSFTLFIPSQASETVQLSDDHFLNVQISGIDRPPRFY